MDVTITKYMSGLKKENRNYLVSDVINNVKKYDGILNLLWHNNSYVDYLNSENEELLNSIMKQAVK